jgi:PAS domain S-box-containing protein
MTGRTPSKRSWPGGNDNTSTRIRNLNWSATPLGPTESWPESLKRMVDFVLASPLAMILLWGPERIQIYNEPNHAFMGSKHPDAFGQPAGEDASETLREEEALHGPALAGEAVTSVDQSRFAFRNGQVEEIHFTTYRTPIRDETGATVASLATSFETIAAPRKRASGSQCDLAMGGSEARLGAAADFVGLDWHQWELRSKNVVLHSGMRGLWGLSPDAPVNIEQVKAAVHADDRQLVEEAWSVGADHADDTYKIEYRIIGIEDGIERWIRGHGRTLYEDGRVKALIEVAFDITEQKQAEIILWQSRQTGAEGRLRQFAAETTDILWIADTETLTFEYVNPAFEGLSGWKRDVFSRDRKRWLELVHDEDQTRVFDSFQRAALGDVSLDEFRIVPSGGGVRWIRNAFFPIRDKHGRFRRVGGIAHEITRSEGPFVYLVGDDDQDCLGLLRNAGYEVIIFRSGRAFLEVASALASGCVLLNLGGPEAGSTAVAREVKARRLDFPIVVLGGARGDAAFAVRVMKSGAADFLPSPCDPVHVVQAVASSLADSHRIEKGNDEAARARAKIEELSSRERQVLLGLLAGKTNKKIGRDIDLSPRTVEAHRARILQRLGVRTVLEAVVIATAAGLHP